MTWTIQLRRDTAANWSTYNPVLGQGELGIETDTSKGKLGNGSTTWNSLPYWAPGGAPLGVVTPPAVPASGTALLNPFGRNATVYVNGTLTGNTQVGGSSLGVPATVVRVPAGLTIALTFTSTPTWVWVLD